MVCACPTEKLQRKNIIKGRCMKIEKLKVNCPLKNAGLQVPAYRGFSAILQCQFNHLVHRFYVMKGNTFDIVRIDLLHVFLVLPAKNDFL